MAQSRKTKAKPSQAELISAHAELELRPGATLNQIKESYRRLARALHPDLNPGLLGCTMARVNKAYQTLLDHLSQSDPSRPKPRPTPPPPNPYFAGPLAVRPQTPPAPPAPAAGQNEPQEALPLSNYRLTGVVKADGGLIYQVEVNGHPDSMRLPLRRRRACRVCHGSGVITNHDQQAHCSHCGGRGRIVCSEGVDVPLPGDWTPGQRLRLPGESHEGPVVVELTEPANRWEV